MLRRAIVPFGVARHIPDVTGPNHVVKFEPSASTPYTASVCPLVHTKSCTHTRLGGSLLSIKLFRTPWPTGPRNRGVSRATHIADARV